MAEQRVQRRLATISTYRIDTNGQVIRRSSHKTREANIEQRLSFKSFSLYAFSNF